MWPNPQKTGNLVTFTEDILNGKLHLMCSAIIPLDVTNITQHLFKEQCLAELQSIFKPN